MQVPHKGDRVRHSPILLWGNMYKPLSHHLAPASEKKKTRNVTGLLNNGESRPKVGLKTHSQTTAKQ